VIDFARRKGFGSVGSTRFERKRWAPNVSNAARQDIGPAFMTFPIADAWMPE
jgi:hypothetical protein